MKKLIVIAEEYNKIDHMLVDTLKNDMQDCRMYYLQDAPFLPKGHLSIYEYYLMRHEKMVPQEKDLYYVFIDVPEFWEIQAHGTNGAVIYQGKKKAIIYFRHPIVARLVQRVEWQTEKGHVYKIDYYNRYGWVYCSAFTNDAGMVISKSYYNSQREELIHVNLSNGVVSLFENGKVTKLYHNVTEFEEAMIRELVSEADVVVNATVNSGERIVTVAKEIGATLISCVPNITGADKFLIMSNSSTARYMADSEKNEYKVPYSRANYPASRGGRDVFLLTASDSIFGLEQLVERLPHMNFHIAARTMMSTKLMNMKDMENVYLYPGIDEENIEKLLGQCDFYLDCNYLNEVEEIVSRAAYENLLILAYENWMHNRDYVLDENIYGQGAVEDMIQTLDTLSKNPEALEEMKIRQQQKARLVIRTIME